MFCNQELTPVLPFSTNLATPPRNQNKGGRLGLGRIRVALADEWLAMLGRRRGGRELLEMTVHPENIVSGGENSSEAASSYPAESGDRCGKKTTLENRTLR